MLVGFPLFFGVLHAPFPWLWVLLFLTVFVIDQFSGWLRKKLVGDQSFLVSA